MARTTALKIDSADLARAGANLGDLTGEVLGQVVVTSLNEVIDSTYGLARSRMNAGINIADDYMRRKMRVDHATAQKPEASITASGSRSDLTSLSHYGAQQHLRPVKRPARSKGNPAIGIPAGQKAAGRSVQVSRGSRKLMPSTFSIAGKRDNDGNLLVFRRKSNGKLESLLGPSVYQLFAYQVNNILDETADDLAETLTERAEKALQKAIE